MEFRSALALPDGKGLTAIVGGGGKTSLMYRLAAEYASAGRSAVVTTTARIAPPTPGQAALLEAAGFAELESQLRPGAVLCFCRRGIDGKLHFPGQKMLERALVHADRVIAEADGSRGLPVKAPAGHEPCIPPESDTVVAVAGLSALGRPIREVSFRCELVCRLLGAGPEEILTADMLAKLIASRDGLFKDVRHADIFRVLLNQADDGRLTELGCRTAEALSSYSPGSRVVVGSLLPVPLVRAVFA